MSDSGEPANSGKPREEEAVAAPPQKQESNKKEEKPHETTKEEEEQNEFLDPERKPFRSAFQQQKMKHFYPQHEPITIILCMFLVAVVFIPIGAAIIVSSDSIYEQDIRYDNINSCTSSSNQGIATYVANTTTFSMGCRTRVPFYISSTVEAPVYIYYRIKGMYQSYRQYAISKSESQLGGTDVDRDDVASCDPWAGPTPASQTLTIDGASKKYDDLVYHPCGAVAWSMFNDTIALYSGFASQAAVPLTGTLPTSATLVCNGAAFDRNGDPTTSGMSCEKKGIALSIDKSARFKGRDSSASIYSGNGYTNTNDPYFQNGWYAGEPGHQIPRGDDEDFMVWSRLAGIPDFRKLYRKVTTNLNPGWYALEINEFWDATTFEGEKHVIIATTDWIGGKNPVLGILYLVFGSLSFVLAIGFIVAFIVKSKGPSPTDESHA